MIYTRAVKTAARDGFKQIKKFEADRKRRPPFFFLKKSLVSVRKIEN